MKICHVISSLAAQRGGPSKAVLDLAQWQVRYGHSVTILTANDGAADDLSEQARAAGIDVVKFERAGPELIRYLVGFSRYLARNGKTFDLFVLHSSYQYPALATAHFCRRNAIPYIFMPHGSLDPVVRNVHPLRNRILDFAYHDFVIRNAAACHFTSEVESLNCERRIWKTMFVESLGIDTDEFPDLERAGAFRKRFGIPDSATLLLFLSRVTKKKGIDILLEAFRQIAAERPDVYLALCGPVDKELLPDVDRVRREVSIGSRLVVPGMVLGDLKNSAFLDADYFVLPTYSENFGIAVFEALAYGLPVLTTTGMDLHRELAECDHVRIVAPTLSGFLSELRRVLQEKWKPAGSLDDTRRWLTERFSWRESARRILRHYEDVTSGNPK